MRYFSVSCIFGYVYLNIHSQLKKKKKKRKISCMIGCKRHTRDKSCRKILPRHRRRPRLQWYTERERQGRWGRKCYHRYRNQPELEHMRRRHTRQRVNQSRGGGAAIANVGPEESG